MADLKKVAEQNGFEYKSFLRFMQNNHQFSLKASLFSDDYGIKDGFVDIVVDSYKDYLKHLADSEVKKEEDKSIQELRKKAIEERQRLQKDPEITKEVLQDNNGIYQYKTISVAEGSNGITPTEEIDQAIYEMSRNGWRLKIAYSSPIGVNSHVETSYGLMINTSVRQNATVCEHVLIFERFIKNK